MTVGHPSKDHMDKIIGFNWIAQIWDKYVVLKHNVNDYVVGNFTMPREKAKDLVEQNETFSYGMMYAKLYTASSDDSAHIARGLLYTNLPDWSVTFRDGDITISGCDDRQRDRYPDFVIRDADVVNSIDVIVDKLSTKCNWTLSELALLITTTQTKSSVCKLQANGVCKQVLDTLGLTDNINPLLELVLGELDDCIKNPSDDDSIQIGRLKRLVSARNALTTAQDHIIGI